MHAELRAYLAVSRRLPNVVGAGAVANVMKRVYTRKKREPVEVEVLGARMVLEPNELVDRDLLFAPQLYDRSQFDFLHSALRTGDTFVDAGANVGAYSLVASPVVGASGRVLAIEADPYNNRKFLRNIALSGATNVKALQVGLSDAEAVLPFSPGLFGNRGGGSFAWQDKAVPVVTRPLKAILDEEGIEHVSVMKMDIELFEHRVMKRFFNEAPREQWPVSLLMERHDDAKYMELAGGDVIALCEDHGYGIVWRRGCEFALTRGA